MSKDFPEQAFSRNSRALSFSPRRAYTVAIVYGEADVSFSLCSKSRRIFSASAFLPNAESACARATAARSKPDEISIAFLYLEIAC
jgi:hypothetical protein